MKKKIKDLTLKEFVKFCNKYNEDCVGCPLNNIEYENGESSCDFGAYICERDNLEKRYKKYPLEQEIEVDLDEMV